MLFATTSVTLLQLAACVSKSEDLSQPGWDAQLSLLLDYLLNVRRSC